MSVKANSRRVKEAAPAARKGTQKGKPRPEVAIVPPARPIPRGWIWAGGLGAALLAVLIAYWPALQGEFVFDDVHMAFMTPHPEKLPLAVWVKGSRPFTEFSYWVNYQMGGTQPLGYHLTNVLLHFVGACMVFLIVRKILELASIPSRRAMLVAGFCGAIFLLHPVQTEAVAYVSSRSETLSVALAFAAWAAFLYRPAKTVGAGRVLLVLLLCGAAVAGKEHVALLPLALLLTDYYWNPGFSFAGIWRNWRLYGTLAILGAILGAFLYVHLSHEPTIGFHMKEFTWYQYLFTQCRVLFIYLRLFLLPFGQDADYDIALSHTPLEHGAFLGMAALAAATVAAFIWRKRFPIASFGFFVSLIFFLPTSSIMPIKDLAAERRLYLPMIGFLLMAAEVLVRVRWSERLTAGVLAAIVVAAGVLTWDRSQVWSSSLALWTDTVEKSPEKPRAQFGLAVADFSAGRFAEAIQHYDQANRLFPYFNGTFYSNWAWALEQAGRHKEAVTTGRKAVQVSPIAPTYDILARIEALDNDVPQALELLAKAEKNDPSYEPVYIDRANILMALDRNAEACAAYQKASSINPRDPWPVKGLTALHCPGTHSGTH